MSIRAVREALEEWLELFDALLPSPDQR